jgi:ABC-type glycerol-3-phosphate transport system substrate-binding protein
LFSAFEAGLEEYASSHADEVEIVVQATASDAHRDKIRIDIAGGSPPDLFFYWLGAATMQPLVESGLVMEVDDYFDLSGVETAANWTDSAWKWAEYDGTEYALPLNAARGFFLVNRELFDRFDLEYPRTFEEMVAVGRVFRDNGIIPFAMASKGGNPSHHFFNVLAYQFEGGAEAANSLGETFDFSHPAFLRAAQAVEQMRSENLIPEDTIANGGWEAPVALYNEEMAAMCYTFTYMAANIKPETGAKSDIIDFVKLPGGSIPPAFSTGGVSMGLFFNRVSMEDAGKRDALVDLADFIVSDEMFSQLVDGGMIPAKLVDVDLTQSDNPMLGRVIQATAEHDFYVSLKDRMPTPATQQLYRDALDELFAGVIDANGFVQKVQAGLDEAEAENR